MPNVQQTQTNPLFTPFTLNDQLLLPNRIVMAPMSRYMSKGHIIDQASVAYYRKRARGGVGLIITEGTTINHPGASPQALVPQFHGDEALAAWQQVVDAVHQEGGLIFPQLWHVGSNRDPAKSSNPEIPAFGPSAIVHPVFKDTNQPPPHELTIDEIQQLIAAYASAARDAKDLGFDGVEIHGAHGYLIDQFFWDKTNQREDEYGGQSLVERTRFAVEVIRSVRHAVGPDFPISFRFSQWKVGDYQCKLAKDPVALKAFLMPLVQAGVDIFHCSTRWFYKNEFENSPLNLAGWTKKLTNKPVITVGSVGLNTEFMESRLGKSSHAVSLDALTQQVAQQEFDLVAVGRGLIANWDWANKVQSGQFNDMNIFSAEMLDTLI